MLGGHRGPPEKSTARQPAGYQAVLRANLHETAVSAACIASKAGLVALGDASGDLSVLNLSRVRPLTPAQHAFGEVLVRQNFQYTDNEISTEGAAIKVLHAPGRGCHASAQQII